MAEDFLAALAGRAAERALAGLTRDFVFTSASPFTLKYYMDLGSKPGITMRGRDQLIATEARRTQRIDKKSGTVTLFPRKSTPIVTAFREIG